MTKREEEIIIKKATETVIAMRGVSSLGGKGIKLEKTREGYDINVNVNVVFGQNIPEIAWNIQESVKNALMADYEGLSGKININIIGVE